MKRITQKEVLQAIQDSGGIMSTIARRLNCNWNTARNYCEKWEATRQALTAETESTIDEAESAIIKAIKKHDINICKWYLSTKGKGRGYTTELQETEQGGNEKEDTEIRIIIDDCPPETMKL